MAMDLCGVMTRGAPMRNDTLPVAAVRMVISGSIVERRDTHEVLSMIDSRLRSSSSTGLAVGSVNPDHLHHFRTVSTAPSGQLEWLLLADGMPRRRESSQ
jgi:N-acetylglucosaminyldiphosphoundecaprenol N-acetyl-beta-D-mannosaminyltransferase